MSYRLLVFQPSLIFLAEIRQSVAIYIVGMLIAVAKTMNGFYHFFSRQGGVGLPVACHHPAQDWRSERGAVGYGQVSIVTHQRAILSLGAYVWFHSSVGTVTYRREIRVFTLWGQGSYGEDVRGVCWYTYPLP